MLRCAFAAFISSISAFEEEEASSVAREDLLTIHPERQPVQTGS